MAITYNFIVYSRRISAAGWILGMKALHGEVPLDIIVPEERGTSDAAEKGEVVGVLTTEGLERESPEGLELYRYLRQLNPKKNDTFGYNEVVIRNIHARLRELQVDQEIRVQVTYIERKNPYRLFSYQMKLLGIFDSPEVPTLSDDESEVDVIPLPIQGDQSAQEPNTAPEERKEAGNPEQPVYKTTNTLEKLIEFVQNLQKELTDTRRELADTVKKVQHLEEAHQQTVELHGFIQELLERIGGLERLEPRIGMLETDRQELHDLQQIFRKFLSTLHHQTYLVLQECEDAPQDQTKTHD